MNDTRWLLALLAFTPACATSHVIAEDVPRDAGTDMNVTFPLTDAQNDASTNDCSNDLRDVIDPQGNLIKTCEPNKGCSRGECIPACDAAAATHSSIGCDYFATTPRFLFGVAQPCYAVLVTNNWAAPIPIHVSRAGVTYDPTKFGRIAETGKPETMWQPLPASGVPVGKVAVLFLSDDPASQFAVPLTCPIPPALRGTDGSEITPNLNGGTTGRGKAWHVTTDLPVTTYDILGYAHSPLSSSFSSGSLLFPTSAWGKNYFAYVAGPQKVHNGTLTNMFQFGQLVAMEDGTQVNVLPNVDLPGGQNVSAALANMKTSYTLNAGDYIQWQRDASASGGNDWDMSGTVIQSSAPVTFIGGASNFSPDSLTFQSSIAQSAEHKQIPAISSYGFEYAVAPHATRLADLTYESIPYRVLAAADGTTLTYDPPIPGAPTALKKGQVAAFEAKGGFVVRSQDSYHPFLIAQVMATTSFWSGAMMPPVSRPGCNKAVVATYGKDNCSLGSPESVMLLPPAQYLNKYVFFSDPLFATSNLVFVRTKTTSGFEEVTLDCAGTLTGWKPIGTSGKYEMMDIDLVRGETPNGNCNNGPHTASSKGPFGVVVWGLDAINSYAYPAGGNANVVNPVVVQVN